MDITVAETMFKSTTKDDNTNFCMHKVQLRKFSIVKKKDLLVFFLLML